METPTPTATQPTPEQSAGSGYRPAADTARQATGASESSSIFGHAVEQVSETVGRIEAKLRETTDLSEEKIREIVSHAKASSQEGVSKVRTRIEHRPLESVLIAAIVGFLVAFLCGRSR